MKRLHKYGAKKTECKQGHVHHSRKEAGRCDVLTLCQKANEISGLKQQPSFCLQEGFTHAGKCIRMITYRADFEYTELGKRIVEETKGYKTYEYQIKRKIFLYRFCQDGEVEFRET